MSFHKRHIKILIVDDDVHFIHSLNNMLGTLGYSVSVAFSPLEAETLIRQQPFHIVFVDCLMPEMDGYSFAKNIERDFGSSIKVLLMSSVFSSSDINYMEHKNILSMLKKPIAEEALKREVESVMNQILQPAKNKLLTPLLCEKFVQWKDIYKELNPSVYINEGDVLLLFFYLLYSESESTLSLSDGKCSVEIGFLDGNVVYFSEQERSRIVSYFSKKNVLQEEELIPFLEANGTESLHHLISHGMISPHHYIQYVKDGVEWGLKYFSKKARVQAGLKQNPLSESADVEQNLEVNLDASVFIQNMAGFIETDLSPRFLKGMMESLGEYRMDVDHSRRKSWKQYTILPFKFVYDQIGDLNSSVSLKDLLNMYPREKDAVHQAVFWLLSQGVITLKQDLLAQIGEVYAQRYQALYKIIRGMDVVQIFEFLGCRNTSDPNHIKKIFSVYTEHNHVDLFSQYSTAAQTWVRQCHQIVNNAYNIVKDSKKLKSYDHKKQIKEAADIIEVENLKKRVQKLIQHKKYEMALKLGRKIKSLKNISQTIKDEIFLWEVVIEMERSSFSLSTHRLKAVAEQIQIAVQQSSLPMYLYFYVSGLLEFCEGNEDKAEFFYDKSVKENPQFAPAKIKQLMLKDTGKTKFLNLEKVLKNKKKTA